MKRIATLAAGTTLALAGTLGTVGTANAAPAPSTCAQFAQIRTVLPFVQSGQGTSRWQVSRILGRPGHYYGAWTVPDGTRLVKTYRATGGVFVVSYFRATDSSVFHAALKSTAVRDTRGLTLTTTCS